MNLAALLLAVANLGLLAFFFKRFVEKAFDAVALYLFAVGLFLISRPIVLSLGLHQLWPRQYFVDEVLSSTALLDAQFLVTLWLVGSAIGLSVARGASFNTIKYGRIEQVTDQQILIASIILLGVSALATIPLWAQFGGPSGLTRAFKIEKTVSLPILRLVPLTGTIIAAASLLSRFRSNSEVRRVGRTAARFAIFAICAYFSFSWGARDAPVLGLLIILSGRIHFSRSRLSKRAQFALVVVLVGCSIVGLRLARDIAISDNVNTSITSQNLVGQVSVASNLVSFDALSLVVRDGPPGGEFHFGQDFLNAVRLTVPGLPRPDDTRNVALQVAQTYQPNRNNGWPVTALGDWYINFGSPGALAGGIISGMLAGYIRDKARNFSRDPLVFAITFFMMGTSFQGGLWARSFSVAFQQLLVLALVIWGMRFLSVRTDTQSATGSPLLRSTAP